MRVLFACFEHSNFFQSTRSETFEQAQKFQKGNVGPTREEKAQQIRCATQRTIQNVQSKTDEGPQSNALNRHTG